MANAWKHLNIANGEGLDEDDINDLVREWEMKYLTMRLWSSMPAVDPNQLGVPALDPGAASAPFLHAANGMSGGIRNTTVTPMTFGCNAGILYHAIAADGDQPLGGPLAERIVCAYVEKDQITGALATADATFDRWDSIGVRFPTLATGESVSRDFEDAATRALTSTSTPKRRAATIETIVVTGTPGASPTIPALPAGYCRWAAVKVPAGYSAGGLFSSSWDIYDYRIPGSIYSVNVLGSSFACGVGYAPQTGVNRAGSCINSGGAANDLAFAVPGLSDRHGCSRLIGVEWRATVGPEVRIVQASLGTSGVVRNASKIDISALHVTNGNQHVNLLLDNSGAYPPIWSHGGYSPLLATMSDAQRAVEVALEFLADASSRTLYYARFWFAGQLGTW